MAVPDVPTRSDGITPPGSAQFTLPRSPRITPPRSARSMDHSGRPETDLVGRSLTSAAVDVDRRHVAAAQSPLRRHRRDRDPDDDRRRRAGRAERPVDRLATRPHPRGGALRIELQARLALPPEANLRRRPSRRRPMRGQAHPREASRPSPPICPNKDDSPTCSARSSRARSTSHGQRPRPRAPFATRHFMTGFMHSSAMPWYHLLLEFACILNARATLSWAQ